ncbi:hydroxymethylglutaryl-CoA lyase, partial [Eremomyces bilateralis CBS 781.70]
RSFASIATPSSDDHVEIIEVGARDGLQNEKQAIPLETKIKLIERLAQTGLKTIEVGSFVSPKWTPQMANSSEILQHVLETPPQSPHPISYQFLVPNQRGFDNFLSTYSRLGYVSKSSNSEETAGYVANDKRLPSAIGTVDVSLFTAATESFTQKNTNCSISESLDRFRPIVTAAKALGLPVRAYISVALGCPYEGPVAPQNVSELAINLLEMGADEISVADTTGMGTPTTTRTLLKTLKAAGIEMPDIALHFHDTYGQALPNALVSLEYGVRKFDAAVAGLGGCPYSPGATGNVSSEDLVYMMESLGARTGVDLGALSEVGDWISHEVGRRNESRAGKALLAKRKK